MHSFRSALKKNENLFRTKFEQQTLENILRTASNGSKRRKATNLSQGERTNMNIYIP